MEIQQPKRVTRTHIQKIEGTPDQIFPLFCPVREVDWVAGWDPLAVISDSGVAELDCVFRTSDGTHESVWAVTAHDPKAWHVQMVKCTPGVTMCRLEIDLEPIDDRRTSAQVTYSHTSLGPEGDALVEAFTDDFYLDFMEKWEASMNHYLRTGEKLE